MNREAFIPLFEENFSKKEYLERVDSFIFFATNGCGDYYCYRVRANGVPDETTIYIWEHENIEEKCCWKPVAKSMEELIIRYYGSEI